MQGHRLFLAAILTVASDVLGSPGTGSAPTSRRIWGTSPGQYSTKNVLTNYSYSDEFPIGNGRLGALVQGAVTDYLTLNDDAFWSGDLLHRVNPDAAETVTKMRELVLEGNSFEAQDLSDYGYQGTPVSARHYEPLGYLTLEQMINGSTNEYLTAEFDTVEYRRWLDLENGTANVIFTDGENTNFSREYLASYPADVIAIRLASDRPHAISFRVHLDRGKDVNRWQDYSKPVDTDTIIIGGASASTNPVQWSVGAKVSAQGGTVRTLGDYVICEDADEATIFVKSWTTFRKQNPRAAVLEDLRSFSNQDFDAILGEHVADYKSLADQASVDLGKSSDHQRSLETSSRVDAMGPNTFDPELASLYFDFGRHLLISSSRRGTLPSNLQGIWNDYIDPNWGSKYTLNINLEMNYWPSLTTGLEEAQLPLHDLLKAMRNNSKEVCFAMYGSRGLCAHSNTDAWGDVAPQDSYISATVWPLGAGWLATHVFEYYRFTGDLEMLRDMYEVLTAAVEFALDFLTPAGGYMVTNPSLSPENTFIEPRSGQKVAITAGPTIDTAIIRELFNMVIEADRLLGVNDSAFLQRVTDMKSKLAPLRLNQFGGIAEWMQDFEEAIPGNGHMSNLWPAYPGGQITSANTTTFAAAKVSLDSRLSHGGGECGWPRAWTINLASRLFLPDIVHDRLANQIGECTWGKNLFNQGFPAPLQVDGNFGATAGIVEALLQSHELVKVNRNGTLKSATLGQSGVHPLIRILPALPLQWAENGGGSFKGLRARGGFVVDASWDEKGQFERGNITSLLGNEAYVVLGDSVIGHANRTQIRMDNGTHGTFVKLSGGKNTTHHLYV